MNCFFRENSKGLTQKVENNEMLNQLFFIEYTITSYMFGNYKQCNDLHFGLRFPWGMYELKPAVDLLSLDIGLEELDWFG